MSLLTKKQLTKKRAITRWVKPNRDKIYIVPTAMGIVFILTTFVMILVGSGYNNNLVNVLAFFMFSLVFVSMVLTQVQLKGVSLDDLEMDPAFAGKRGMGQAIVRVAGNAERWGIELETSGPTRLRGSQSARVVWQFDAPVRGKHQLDRVEMSSIFPLGLFRAWKMIPVKVEYWVYPKLEGELPLPEQVDRGNDEVRVQSSGDLGDDFKGHRNYVLGDSPRQIDWKARARGRPLLIKEMNEGEPPERVLDWQQLQETDLDLEAKLSQLAKWIYDSDQRGFSITLRMPGTPDLSGKGSAHTKKCLERLAEEPA